MLSSVVGTSIPPSRKTVPVFVQKCCKKYEIYVDNKCTLANKTHEAPWTPSFRNKEGQLVFPNYSILTDIPACGTRLSSSVYHAESDRLILLPDGTLRHYIITSTQQYDDILDEDLNEEMLHFDYKLGYYCREKVTIFISSFSREFLVSEDV